MNAYAAFSDKRLAGEYRAAYAAHQELAAAYADGRADVESLRASASNLKAIRVAFAAEREANKVRKH